MNDLDGATSRPAENVRVQTPGEFAAIWNTQPLDARQRWLTAIQTDSDTATKCSLSGHTGYIAHLESQLLSANAKLDVAIDIIDRKTSIERENAE